ncbi:DUF177 domain-containing protein [Bacillota bacterium LX-D]|nr:DUF177 domain-containing protein [Bacillota bacterium LX-D]
MIIDLAKLRAQPEGSKEFRMEKEFEPISWADEVLTFLAPVQVDFVATYNNKVLHVEGQVQAKLNFTCSRCLQPFIKEFNTKIAAEFRPKVRREEEVDAENVYYYSGDLVDLTDAILENILLELPMKAICTENCLGLCMKCGKNLNEGPCTCSTQEIDPRLQELQKFFSQERS